MLPDPPSSLSLSRIPAGAVAGGSVITVTCSRGAAKPSPVLKLMKNGQKKANGHSVSVQYRDTDTDKRNNLMNYTCEATGEAINGTMISNTLTVPLQCKHILSSMFVLNSFKNM